MSVYADRDALLDQMVEDGLLTEDQAADVFDEHERTGKPIPPDGVSVESAEQGMRERSGQSGEGGTRGSKGLMVQEIRAELARRGFAGPQLKVGIASVLVQAPIRATIHTHTCTHKHAQARTHMHAHAARRTHMHTCP